MMNFKSIFLSLLLIATISSFAQKDKKVFTGIITYKPNLEGFSEAEKLNMPKSMDVIYGSSKSKTTVSTAMGDQTIIMDSEKKEMFILIDVMGKKIAMDNSEEIRKSLEEVKDDDIEILKLDETKKIAGYKCKKAVVIAEEDTSYVYYTDELYAPNANWTNEFKDIEGVTLEMTMPAGEGKKLIFSAENVKKKKIKDKVFIIPEDYEKMTAQELQDMFGG